ncbi:MAG TPA: DUF501 domain-containing protein [Nitriliruptorales bacterium]|nr:DUF501 domain-containing protein [Nitriliruptorales bacterium]
MTDTRSSAVTVPGDDALRADPDASYHRAATAPRMPPAERAVVSAQLGRVARGDNAVVHRCVYGLPSVVRVHPYLEDGAPFPTVFWLTCPLARRHVGRLEADGAMALANRRLEEDPDCAAVYAAAAERYVGFRDRLDRPIAGDPTAGGMPTHVKCLHVHHAHFLATGDNPVGAWTHRRLTPMACPGPCVEESLLADAYGPLPPDVAMSGAWEHAAPWGQRPRGFR